MPKPPTKNTNRVTKQKFIRACKESGGVISVIARRLGLKSRRTVYNYLKRFPLWQIYVDEAKEEMLDVAENRLHEKVNEGDTGLIKWYLATIGKKRGYVEKVETEFTGNLNHSFNVELVELGVDEIRGNKKKRSKNSDKSETKRDTKSTKRL